MGENTEISWCDHTANLWWGCSEVHAGCDNCYARIFARAKGNAAAWDGVRFAAKSWVASDNFGDDDGPEAHADYASYIIPALITEVERLRSDVATLEMGLAWLVDWINGRRI